VELFFSAQTQYRARIQWPALKLVLLRVHALYALPQVSGFYACSIHAVVRVTYRIRTVGMPLTAVLWVIESDLKDMRL